MAQSGAALIVVENASITPNGSGSTRTIRCDHNRYINGLEKLARSIKDEKSLSGLQINHAGRFAHVPNPVAPSAVTVFNRTPKTLNLREIATIQKQYANAALSCQKSRL